MKKILFFAFLLICMSAFAFKPNFCYINATGIQKKEIATPKQSPTPIEDMVMFPHLAM